MSRRQTHGTRLMLGDGYDYFADIAQVRTITPPEITRGVTTLADHDMTETMEYLPNGLGEVGPATFSLYLDPQDGGHQELEALARSAEIVPWKIELPGGAGTWTFSGFVTRYAPGEIAANDGVLEAGLSIQAVAAPESY